MPANGQQVAWGGGGNLNNAVILVPTTNTRNVIQPDPTYSGGSGIILRLNYGSLQFLRLPSPGAPTATLVNSAGNLSAGAYTYKLTFVNHNGETELGTISNTITVVTPASAGQISLTAIPLGLADTTQRKIYRTAAGGSAYFLLATIADNTTTTYPDNTADSGLGTIDFTNKDTTSGARIAFNSFALWNGLTSTAFGTNSLASGPSAGGWGNTAIGVLAMGTTTSGYQNVAIGEFTMEFANDSYWNTAVGQGAMLGVMSAANHNTGVGVYALNSLTSGVYNTAIGANSLNDFLSGNNNVAIGNNVGYATGVGSGTSLTTGNYNVFIGANTISSSGGQVSNAIAIGAYAWPGASHIMVLGAAPGNNGATPEVLVGSGLNLPTAKLHIVRTDAVTNTVTDVAIFDHESSGTVAANYGTGILLRGKDNATVNTNMAAIRTKYTVATDASYATQTDFQAYDKTGGATPRTVMSIGGNNGAAVWSVFGVTPVIRPVTGGAAAAFVANTSGIANDTATWGGYTIGQVVKALQNEGILT